MKTPTAAAILILVAAISGCAAPAQTSPAASQAPASQTTSAASSQGPAKASTLPPAAAGGQSGYGADNLPADFPREVPLINKVTADDVRRLPNERTKGGDWVITVQNPYTGGTVDADIATVTVAVDHQLQAAGFARIPGTKVMVYTNGRFNVDFTPISRTVAYSVYFAPH